MKVLMQNKKVISDYEILEKYEAGIVLKGFEVKALKYQHGNLSDAIIRLVDNDVSIVGMQIPLYEKTAPNMAKSYQPKATRTLLLHKKEISKIYTKTHKTGNIIIPIQVFENDKKKIKLLFGIGSRLKKYEKKQVLKERDLDRQIRRGEFD